MATEGCGTDNNAVAFSHTRNKELTIDAKIVSDEAMLWFSKNVGSSLHASNAACLFQKPNLLGALTPSSLSQHVLLRHSSNPSGVRSKLGTGSK